MKRKLRIKVLALILILTFILITLARSIPLTSIVEGRVKDVFGDPLPMAEVTLGKHTTTTDEMGNFSFEDLKPGLYKLMVKAKGYLEYDYEFLAEIGRNHIEIREENGLKPTNFAVDFHVFYAPTYVKKEELFVLVGLFNGTKSKVVIESLNLVEPGAFEGEKIALITEAIILEPASLKKLELSGIASPITQGVYLLQVEYQIKGEKLFWEFHDTAQYDADWDPHR